MHLHRIVSKRKSFWLHLDTKLVPILILFILTSMLIFPVKTLANDPSSMELEYDSTAQKLNVTITHNVADPNTHHIKTVEIYLNNVTYLTENYTNQPSTSTFTYIYDVEAVDGDLIKVTAICSISGSITEEIYVIAPSSSKQIDLVFSPKVTEIDENTPMIFTIEATSDGEPLEGVMFSLDVKLGSVSTVQMKSSGSYEFTYTSPGVNQDLEEILNIRGEKAGLKDGVLEVLFAVNDIAETGDDCPPTLDGTIDSGEYEFTAEFDGGKLRLHWRVDDDAVHMALEGRTTGWVAIGIEPEYRMEGADMILGLVTDSGEVRVVDAYATGPTGPHPRDTELGGTNDILCFGGSENDGTTIVEFKRLLSTGDDHDKEIPVSGEMTIIWAYGSRDDFNSQHSSRGYGTLNLESGEYSEIDNLPLWIIHAFFMSLGFIILLIGVIIAKVFKKKKWWFKYHKILNITGSVLGLLGVILGFIMVSVLSGTHFRVPHAYVGTATVILLILTLVLGFAIPKVQNKKKVRMFHRWSGRITISIMLLNIIFGLSVAGVI